MATGAERSFKRENKHRRLSFSVSYVLILTFLTLLFVIDSTANTWSPIEDSSIADRWILSRTRTGYLCFFGCCCCCCFCWLFCCCFLSQCKNLNNRYYLKTSMCGGNPRTVTADARLFFCLRFFPFTPAPAACLSQCLKSATHQQQL